MYFLLRPLLFTLSPETAHKVTLGLLSFALKVPGMKALFSTMYNYQHPTLEREVFGLKFPNPVGLAAGFDKDAKHRLGDLKTQSFKDIWQGEPYQDFRSRILLSRKEIDICKNCTEGLKVWA